MYLTGIPFGIAAWFILPALAMLPFAHVLASLQPTPDRRNAWFMGSWMLAAGVIYITLARHLGNAEDAIAALRYPMLAGIVGLPAFGALLPVHDVRERVDQSTVPTARLEIVTIGLTPILALGVWMPASAGGALPLFLLWLLIVALASRFTVAPLVRFVQRTQRQRDLVVAASEAERARLAADLHDDALQDLISLVRRLDAHGDTEGAEMARHVAERLRAICSDLRLPLLDDLGAGAALEWLVSRVEPLAGGSVQLERADSSRPPSNVELAVFRVAQEAVSNAVRHGSAPITVRYHVTDAGRVSLSVEDAGPGIDLEQAEAAQQAGHFGLANMQQRAEQIGALLNVRRWPGGGTHVGLEWKPR
jgi:signal transduction histidine kinase